MGENRHTKQDLQQLQALPLKLKIRLTQQRIREWVNEYGVDGVYVSFSGGKDSTVLLHIARQMYPEIKAAFSNTGIEFPEIVKFVNTFSNVDIVRSKMPFVEVVKKYGYPMISKEVSECVSGARKYLTQVIEENSIAQSVSQSGQKWHYQKYRQLCGQAEYKKYYGGGYENKYRRLRGIGNYALDRSGEDVRNWQILQAVKNCQKTGLGGGRSCQRLREPHRNQNC